MQRRYPELSDRARRTTFARETPTHTVFGLRSAVERAAAVGVVDVGGEGDVLGAGFELLVGALVARRLDLPLAVDLDVGVLVEGGAPDVDAELELGDGVGKCPDAGGRVGPRDVDLGLAHAVAAQELLGAHRRAQELEDGVPSLERP